VVVNVALSIEEPLVSRARQEAEALARSQSTHLRLVAKVAGGDDPQRSMEFNRLSGGGHWRGLRFSRNEIHQRS
jgi:hypothetical protein